MRSISELPSGSYFRHYDNVYKIHYRNVLGDSVCWEIGDAHRNILYPQLFRHEYIIPIPKLSDMTPLSHQIGMLLLPVCLKTTQRMRDLYKKTEPVCPRDDIKELFTLLTTATAEPKVTRFYRAFAAAIENDPARKAAIASIPIPEGPIQNIHPIYDPFTVIVLTSDRSGHKMIIDVPRIVTHGKNRHTLWHDNEPGSGYNVNDTDKDETRIATDEEVEACVMDLSPRQLRIVMTSDLFAPVVNPLYEEQTELVADEEAPPQDKAIDLMLQTLPDYSKQESVPAHTALAVGDTVVHIDNLDRGVIISIDVIAKQVYYRVQWEGENKSIGIYIASHLTKVS